MELRQNFNTSNKRNVVILSKKKFTDLNYFVLTNYFRSQFKFILPNSYHLLVNLRSYIVMKMVSTDVITATIHLIIYHNCFYFVALRNLASRFCLF